MPRALLRCAQAWEGRMRRREFLSVLGAAALLGPKAGAAQRTYRLAAMNPAFPMPEGSPFGDLIVKAMAKYGYVVGQNLIYDSLCPMGDVTKIAPMLGELKSRGADAIVIIGYPTAVAAKEIGIPIVAAVGLGDPVATGL